MALQPVIMCGGTGSRLWPLSRANMPKPFVKLAGKHTLFQQTARRVSGKGMLPPLVICAESHRFFVLEQLAEIGITPAAVILEPAPRGTAAAIALAARWAAGQGARAKAQAPLVILPADHLMGTPAEFQKALAAAAPLAQKNIVLFGITPTSPNTEYGYIESGKPAGKGAFAVARFVEKPALAKAQAMLKKGGFTWNSGIFTATAAVLEAQFAHAKPVWQQVGKSWQTKSQEQLLGTTLIRPGKAFAQTENQPFDIAVMEKTPAAVVMPYSGAWSDIGSFPALAAAQKADREGNTLSGQTLVTQTVNSFIHATVPHKVVAVHGLEDAVVVDTPDALLVTHKSRAADVKAIFTALQKQNAPQAADHARVVRPWGWYQTIAQGPGFLVKRLGVNPGGRLSLQYHHHRAEHWVITRGVATVTNGQKTLTLKADQSTYIPLGAHHRLENRTKQPLELVEVQTGTKLVEEDIVRLDDVYNRAAQPKRKK